MKGSVGAASSVATRWAWWPVSVLLAVLLAVTAESGQPPSEPADLFRITNLWTVHLKFTPDQWEAMEPKGGGGFFGGPGGPGGPRELVPPGGPRGPGGPGGLGGLGPAMILAPTFMKQADQNQDGRLSKQEFQALAEKWFTAWDKEERGRLDADQVRAGLNATLAFPGFGPPGMAGPGGRPPSMNLQGPEGKRNGLVSAMGIEFEYVHAGLEFEGRPFRDVAVRYKGNGTFLESRGSLKRSLKIDLNKFARRQQLAGVTKLNLQNDVTDASWMNEVMAYWLYRDAGVPAPRTAYARVFVTVPGKHDRTYFGLYSLVENVDKHFEREQLRSRGGAILKPVTPNLFADLGEDWAKYNQTYDPKTRLSDQETQRIIEFCRLVTKASDAEFAAKVTDYMDLDEFARFLAVMVFLSDLDGILGPGQNFYLYLHPQTQKLVFVPWDQDHSFGQFGLRATQEERENLSLHKPWQGENRFLERLHQVAAFKKLYLARLAEFSKTIFKPERFHRQVDAIAAAIRPAVLEESAEKLARFDRAVAGASAQPAGFGGGPGAFMQPSKPIKPFVTTRAQSVLDQLAGRSQGQTLGALGFGGRGGRGGRGGGPGGPGGFGPGMFLGGAFMTALDANQDGTITRDEFRQGFAKWFETWNVDRTGLLTEEQLSVGVNQDLSPASFGPPVDPGFGPPED